MTLNTALKFSRNSGIIIPKNSPNKMIAVISGSGVITAKSAGTVKITGKTYNGKTAVCTVTVQN